MKCYNLDEIITNLKKEIATDRAILAAWESVTFPTKKNGEPFAIMSKNISGATYKEERYAVQPGEMVLTVTEFEKTWVAVMCPAKLKPIIWLNI